MYKLVAFISICIRLLFLPNLATGLPGIWPFLIDGVVHGYTFQLVGVFSQGKIGSAGMAFFYLVFYAVNAFTFVWAKDVWGSFYIIAPCIVYFLFIFVIILISSQIIDQF